MYVNIKISKYKVTSHYLSYEYYEVETMVSKL